MKIATYNVRNLFDPGTQVDDISLPISESFFNQRITYFIETFRSLDLDIICLQEIGGEKGVSRIGEALGYDHFFARPNRRGIRMAVLYKKSLSGHVHCESVNFGEIFIPSVQERGDTSALKPIVQSRDILEITLVHGEKTISINTFHLKSNLPQYLEGDDVEHDSDAYTDGKFRCILYKVMELHALRKHVTKRISEGKEVMLLGDYNENNTASIIDILKGSQDEALRLDDVLTRYHGDPVTHYHRGNKLTFDTILASQGLTGSISLVGVENKDLEDCSQLPLEAEVIKSDHALVWCALEADHAD